MIKLGTLIDFQTQDGARLKARIEERLIELRDKLEQNLDLAATAELRGRIAELKSMLTLPVQGVTAMPSYGAQRRGMV